MTKKLTLILGLLMLTSLLSACAGIFMPKHKTIEYDEEVKLHDGSMIWVHITRHYRLAGELGGGTGYLPSTVEISWDTGFEGVGRKSVYFDALVTIDKYRGTWYIGGAKNSSIENKGDSINCNKFGTVFENYKCVIAFNRDGFIKREISQDSFLPHLNRNIFYPSSVDSSIWDIDKASGTSLDWDTKMAFQESLRKNYADIPLKSIWLK